MSSSTDKTKDDRSSRPSLFRLLIVSTLFLGLLALGGFYNFGAQVPAAHRGSVSVGDVSISPQMINMLETFGGYGQALIDALRSVEEERLAFEKSAGIHTPPASYPSRTSATPPSGANSADWNQSFSALSQGIERLACTFDNVTQRYTDLQPVGGFEPIPAPVPTSANDSSFGGVANFGRENVGQENSNNNDPFYLVLIPEHQGILQRAQQECRYAILRDEVVRTVTANLLLVIAAAILLLVGAAGVSGENKILFYKFLIPFGLFLMISRGLGALGTFDVSALGEGEDNPWIWCAYGTPLLLALTSQRLFVRRVSQRKRIVPHDEVDKRLVAQEPVPSDPPDFCGLEAQLEQHSKEIAELRRSSASANERLDRTLRNARVDYSARSRKRVPAS